MGVMQIRLLRQSWGQGSWWRASGAPGGRVRVMQTLLAGADKTGTTGAVRVWSRGGVGLGQGHTVPGAGASSWTRALTSNLLDSLPPRGWGAPGHAAAHCPTVDRGSGL